ncbi:MAG: SPOR domain-containing protein, partial [Thiotrichales bacterium]|nr:SPOR domain-containing protein [Thiotrichales bacterium]
GEGLLDKDSLRLDDLDELLKEDAAADNGIFKAKKSTPPPKESRAQQADKAEEKSEAEKETEKTADEPEPPAPAEPAPSVAETEEATESPVTEPDDEAVEQARDDTALEEPLDPNLDPEVWARLGGWYRQDDTLYYRPVGHRDPFFRAWFDIGAALHGTRAEVYGADILALFRAKDTPGKCAKCHSVDRLEGGALQVNWRPFAPDPRRQDFTVFDHTAHFSLVEKKGCGTCHEIDAAARFPDGYADFDPRRFASNFAPMDPEVCASCHVESSAGDACTQCHRYHVGEFPITPVRTLIAGLPNGVARDAAGPSAQSPAVETPKGENGAEVVLQLSSLRTLEAATREWLRLKDAHAELLAGKNLVVQRIDLAKQGLAYRVLAHPFRDADAAEDFCGRLGAAAQDCLILDDNPLAGR